MPRGGTIHVTDPVAGKEHGEVWVWTEDGDRISLATEGTTGAQALSRRAVANAAVTVTVDDHLVALTGLTAPRGVSIPTAVGNEELIFIIKDESGNCNTHNITITPVAGNIDGAATKVMTVNYSSVTVYSDGANWFTIT